MKRCPTCNRTADDSQKFCTLDGTVLVAVTPEPPRSAQADPLEPTERIQCQWCQAMNEKTALNCRSCAAPLDIANLVSESGWREAPRIKDMAEIHFGNSTCQVEGDVVPVAEI